jgi:hypothetical protein
VAGANRKGWLWKRGQRNKAFKRRYVVLNGAQLSWYQDELAARQARPAKGTVTLTGARVLIDDADVSGAVRASSAGRFRFSVEATSEAGEPRSLVCESDTQLDCQGWVEAIRAAVPAVGGAMAGDV